MFTTNELNKLATKYKECIKQVGLSEELEKDFLELLSENDLKERKKQWEEILKKNYSVSTLKKLANPFFVGYGNPDASILFLGKEKAFQVGHPNRLFLKESINNILQWEKIIEGKHVDELAFNPDFPRKAFPNLKRRHTWAKYALLLSGILEDSNLTFDELYKKENSFFSKCFLTELNYKPSPKGKSIKKIREDIFFKEREKFLREMIIPRFDVIIIGAWPYFSNQNESQLKKELEALFGEIEECKDTNYLDRKILPFLHYKTKNSKKHIYLTYQLSGSAGWSNEGLAAFAERINAYL